MSSFVLPNWAPECHVNLTHDITKDQLLAFPAFKNWISTLQQSLSQQQNKDHVFNQSPYKLRKIDIQACDWFSSTKLGFVKLKAEVTNDHGEYLPGSIFLRGGSVGMLVKKTRHLLSHRKPTQLTPRPAHPPTRRRP